MVFSALDRKLWRDTGRLKGPMAAVSVVMACGLAMMVMSRSLIRSLETTRDAYYQSHRMADVFCELKRAPNALRDRLAAIEGVAVVETRVVGRLTLDLPGLEEPADGMILSIPEGRPAQLHRLHVRRGRLPDIGRPHEVVVGEAFAQAHGFEPGHTLDALVHGARERLEIVGIALSPEFVYEARAGETLPDNRRFGVFWMAERPLATAFELDGAFNSVLIDVAPGHPAAAVMAELDRVLAPFGGQVAYARRDQPSAMRLDDELRELRALSFAFPTVFLSIAAFMASAVLSRLIRLQREQIAQLKAFGYASNQVGWHYLKFALIMLAAATAVGLAAGVVLGQSLMPVYHRFFRFPELTFRLDLPALALAVLVSAGAAVLGALGAVRQAMRLPPAEAMRPEPPAVFRRSRLERAGGAWMAGPSLRMALRNLERRPWQAVFTALGLALATGLPVMPGAMRDGIAYLMRFQWEEAQRQDVTVSLIEPGSASALADLRHLPGVTLAEPFRSVPARVQFGHRSRRLAVTGLPREALLHRVLDAEGRPIPLPLDGLLLSAKLAEVLGVRPGDRLRIEVQEGRRPVREVTVGGLITDYAGVAVYMEINALRRLMQEGGTLSGAHLTVDPARWSAFLAAVRESPSVAALVIKSAVRDSFNRSTAEMIHLVQGMYFAFSVIVSFGVVYNSARIALAERHRDFATLRVIGFTHREVAAVMLGELVILSAVALPVGLVIGRLLSEIIVATASTESVRLPLAITMRTYATAILIVLASAAVSFAVVSRGIRRLDLLAVLKAHD